MSRHRIVSFVAVCLLATALAGTAIAYGMHRIEQARAPTAASRADTALDIAAVRSVPHIAFRSTARGPTYGQLAMVPLNRPDGPRAVVAGMRCARVDMSRGGGVCLTENFDVLATYRAVQLDAGMEPGAELPMIGVPSRVRLSPGGTLVAVTTFVDGHSYAEAGFSTATTVHDVRSGLSIGNLEEFAVVHEGRPYRAADLNVWGVTFADENRFYATVASQGRTFLAEGDVGRRELRTLREQVECPALSPDGTRVAYKQRTSGDWIAWRLHVFDLRTGRDIALAELRDVDDQVEWLDDGHLLYGLSRQGSDETDIWVVPADGTGQPVVLVPRAWSPAVVRW